MEDVDGDVMVLEEFFEVGVAESGESVLVCNCNVCYLIVSCQFDEFVKSLTVFVEA